MAVYKVFVNPALFNSAIIGFLSVKLTMGSQIFRFLVFPTYTAGLSVDSVSGPCSVFYYFGSFFIHVSAKSLMFLDSEADLTSCFTNILPLTVDAFDAKNYQAIHFLNFLVLIRQAVEGCCPSLIIPLVFHFLKKDRNFWLNSLEVRHIRL
ncbi:unnamed protein product [Protopolystoma xenopodis]|uniref:Uncharacterized protein n=1 Tax=Protopolystoma xenopodis TaxID=117903 RepID=A0A3S4ZZ50_9PLAT|nr:unnamed protein product [Protopolystoma xenopodis]